MRLTPEEEVEMKARRGKEAAKKLATLDTSTKNRALEKMAEELLRRNEFILSENRRDVKTFARKNPNSPLIDRLMLNEKRILEMAKCIREVAALPDPVGEIVGGNITRHGLEITKIRVPLGLIGIIYEARPNVTSDAASLCIKSGNAVLLRGGSEAINSNKAIVKVLNEATKEILPPNSIQIVETTDRRAVHAMLQLREYIDLVIPRGGAGLINFVVENAKVPVIETGVGNCHTYIDADAEPEIAYKIVRNAKLQRPSVCNATKKLLVHRDFAYKYLRELLEKLSKEGAIIIGDEEVCKLFTSAQRATEKDWYEEYLDMRLGIKIVNSVEEAIEHINKYGSKHSEAIITRSYENAEKFLKFIDAAAVYVNASTRFTDGNQFGLGAEIGISTQKLHARGPMGLRELTTTKYVIRGEGQIRE